MKIRTPHYYKDFKCIAGACTDTCCAGWEVDVDADSYAYYQTVSGAFGKRLAEVMVPSVDGPEEGGCTFTLKGNRCPFLNDENLCDLYTELGEDKLCNTCAEFPRFINEYGNTKEIGIAPSCITAGEIIFNVQEKMSFAEEEDDTFPTTYNDIDPVTYMQLTAARTQAYAIVQNRAYSIVERCIVLLHYAKEIQELLDAEEDARIAEVVAKYQQLEQFSDILKNSLKKSNENQVAYQTLLHYFDEFEGMEVINPDWFKVVDTVRAFFENCAKKDGSLSYYTQMHAFLADYKEQEYEFEQLLMYYVYRYFLDAVYDYDVLLKIQNGIVGYLILLQADVAFWTKNGQKLAKAVQVDLAHLYSRQFEHSYTNFEAYSEAFQTQEQYSYERLLEMLGELQ